MMMVQLPAGASYTRTPGRRLAQVESYLSKQAEVTDYMTIVGISGDQASANGFIQLKDWSERKGKGQDARRWRAR
jgi:multidrug efflux pump subunit AcrB